MKLAIKLKPRPESREKMENLGTTMIKNQKSVYIHSTYFKKGFCPLWDQTFISFTVRKLQGIGGRGSN
jgi:hypothetical protein